MMTDEFMELPEGWENVTLGDLGDWSSGGTPLRSHPEYYNGDIPWVKTGNLPDGFIQEIDETITKEGLINSSAKIFPAASLIVAMYGATIGKLGILKEAAATNQACGALIAKGITEKIIPYIFYYLLLSREDLRKIGQGGAQPNISQAILKGYLFPLPPLNEQKRIVAKIEALQERSQRVKAELEAIRPLLDKFRQSVLAAAFRGDLTKDWREKNPDIEPASELLERIKIEQEIWYDKECQKAVDCGRRKPLNPKKNKKSDKPIFMIDNVPDTWKVIRLEDISYLVTDGTHKTPKYQEQGIPFLSVKNVRPFKIYDQDIKFVSQEEYEVINSRCNPEKGDILYTKVGATFGYAAINNLSYDFSIFVSLALIKPVNPYFSSEYAEAVMNSPIIYSQAKERVSGIGTPDLHLIEIRDFKIPLPPLPEQKEIVKRIESLFKIAGTIEQKYQKAETDLKTLNQSILAKAFRGELVPQDPNDEPAST
ncbi:MAG: restriction endonuclease subunit S, partial [Microcoleaceae cyanobacterium]